MEIPNSVTTIGDYAFCGCSGLTSVDIPESVTSIGNEAFKSCTSLPVENNLRYADTYLVEAVDKTLSTYSIKENTKWIGAYAFYKCTTLTSITIPNSVTSIEEVAFYGCSGLTSVTIPNSVTEIGSSAFSGCSGLTSVTIPNSVTEIGDYAFYGCSSLKEITSLAVTPPTIHNETFEGPSKTEAVVKVPDESVAAYQAADYWKAFWNIVGLNDAGGGDDTETKQCAAPTIELVDGKLVATSATEGAKCYLSVTSEDMKGVDGESIILTGVYNITSYAHAEGYQNSETVTATLVWVNPTLETDNILSMEAKKAVLIRTQGGSIIVSGTEQGEGIQLYSVDGRKLCSVSAEDGQTVIPCNAGKGEVVIVKYDDKAVKVMM